MDETYLTVSIYYDILLLDDVSPSELLSFSTSDLDLKETSSFYVQLFIISPVLNSPLNLLRLNQKFQYISTG